MLKGSVKRKALLLPIAVILLLLLFMGQGPWLPASSTGEESCLVIDPGHGGIDCGAVSFAGDKESELNLSIAQKLQLLALFYGEQCTMTRYDDSSYTESIAYSEHQELVKRCEIIEDIPGAVVISIHQNSFPTAQPHGAQVLYAADEESKRLGMLCHSMLVEKLDPENRRVSIPAPDDLYLTAKAQCPTILVECGFMSNLTDLQKLKDQNYQTAFSAVLFSSYREFQQDRFRC